MRCGKNKCRTPVDDVVLVGHIRLCRTHRALMSEAMAYLRIRAGGRKTGAPVPKIIASDKEETGT